MVTGWNRKLIFKFIGWLHCYQWTIYSSKNEIPESFTKDEWLNESFTKDELKAVFKKLKNKKAPWVDELPPAVLKTTNFNDILLDPAIAHVTKAWHRFKLNEWKAIPFL